MTPNPVNPGAESTTLTSSWPGVSPASPYTVPSGTSSLCAAAISKDPTLASGTVQFDPQEDVVSSSKLLFQAPSVVQSYLEKHFGRTLSEDERKAMQEVHPRPDCAAMQCPKVDEHIMKWLGNRYDKSLDNAFVQIQSAVQAAVGPAACLWSALEEATKENGGPDELPVADVLEVLQHTMVLLGNASALVSKHRRVSLLMAKDSCMAKSVKDMDLPPSGKVLFGKDFTTELTAKTKDAAALAEASRKLSPGQAKRRFSPYQPSSARQPFRLAGLGGRSQAPGPKRFSHRFSNRQQSSSNYTRSPNYRGPQGRSGNIPRSAQSNTQTSGN